MSAMKSISLKHAVLVSSPDSARLSFLTQSAVNIMEEDSSLITWSHDPFELLLNGNPDAIPWEDIVSYLSHSVRVSQSQEASTAVVLVWGCGLDLTSSSLLSRSSLGPLEQFAPCVPFPLSLVLFAMHSRGIRDCGARDYLQHVIDQVQSDNYPPMSLSSSLTPAAVEFRSAFLNFASQSHIQSELIIKDLCSSGTRFDEAWLLVQSAAMLCHQLGNCNALSNLMTLIIPMLGHHSGQNDDSRRRTLRDQAMRSLHCLIDGHDLQILHPFEQSWIKTLGSHCTVSVSLPSQHSGKTFAFVLFSPLCGPSMDSGKPGNPALLEAIQMHNSSMDAGRPRAALISATVSQSAAVQGSKTLEVSFELPHLSHCGFYDWKLVSIGQNGKLLPEVSQGATVCGRIIVVAEVRTNAMVNLCPEFVSQSMFPKKQIDRASSSDSFDSQTPTARRDSTRGSFSAAANLFSDLKQQGYNSIHIVDALQRNHGPAPDFALDPPPYMMQVTDRAKFSTALGGDDELAQLVVRAHEMDMTVFIDGAVRVSSSKAASKYQELLLQTVSPGNGYLVPNTHSDSCSLLWAGTSLLNYRKFSAWELTRSDLLATINSSGCDGCVFDSGINWPIMLPQDIAELTSISSDGHAFYTLEDLFFGSVVTTGPAISLYAQKVETCYPSPLLAWLTRCIWYYFPKFCFISDTLAVKSAESKLMTAGVIPCSNSLSNEVLKVLGRHVIPGNMTAVATSAIPENCENLDGFFQGIKTIHKATAVPRLPIGSPIFKVSSPLQQPMPAVLFQRHNWSWVDILTFSPGPFIVDYNEVFGQRQHQFTANGRCGPSLIQSKLENFEQQQNNDVIFSSSVDAVQFGFDLTKICFHYKHRMSLRKEAPVFVLGDIVSLQVKDEADSAVPLITAFARIRKAQDAHDKVNISQNSSWSVSQQEKHSGPDICIVVTSFSQRVEHFYVDLSRLKPWFGSFNDAPKAYNVRETIESPQVDVTVSSLELQAHFPFSKLNPCSSLVWFISELQLQECTHQDVVWKNMMSSAIQRVLASLPLREGKSRNALFGWWSLEQNPILIALWEASNSIKAFVRLLGELALCVLPEKLSELALAVQICLVGLENTGMKQSHSMHLLLQVHNFVDTAKTLFNESSHQVDHCVLDAADCLAAAVLKANDIGPLVFITPELGKWSNVGGLSTMVNELTQGLARAPFNLDITVVSPYYDRNSKGETNYLQKPEYGSIQFKQTMMGIKVGSQAADVGIHVGIVNGVKLIFLHSPLFFPKTYPEGSSEYRMKGITLFAKASLEALCQLSIVPSIIVTNDWFCGLIPAYVKDKKFFGQTFVGTTTFHIIHNLAQDYEGRVWPEPPMTIDQYNEIHGLPQMLLVDQFWSEKVMNPSRCALLKSDQWATVSVSYKEEILKESSLRSLLKSKFDKPFAYSNGLLVDVARKGIADKLKDSAQLDNIELTRETQLLHHVTAKELLQKIYFPTSRPDARVPLFAFVGRITKQKGIHLICDVAESLFRDGKNVQFIVGGGLNKGEKYSEQQASRLRALHQQYPEKFWSNPGQFFSDGKLVNLGADWALMPSEFEPGGIVQHEFFSAGTPVIAFATGGLKDSVVQYNKANCRGNGCVFTVHDFAGIKWSVDTAIEFHEDRSAYAQLRCNAWDSVIDLEEVCGAYTQEFHRLRYKLAPVGSREVALDELQQSVLIMPEQPRGGVGNTQDSFSMTHVVSNSLAPASSSIISFSAP